MLNSYVEPQTPLNLKQYGIDIGLLISGLFGAILLTSKDGALNLTRTVTSLVGGAASANYITPVIISITKLDENHYHYSIAFILGYAGLKGIDYFSRKIIPDHLSDETLIKAKVTRTRKRK
jgi:hypothetical protein